MHQVGIMQGRLLPMVNGRIQAFPGENWEQEFPLAADIGYDTIELTIEMASFADHPVRTNKGRKQIITAGNQSGIGLAGLCCDVFMEKPLTTSDSEAHKAAGSMLTELIRNCGDLGLPMIEVPTMGDNSLKDPAARNRACAILEQALPHAETAGVDIILESDLAPSELAALMDTIDHPRLGINYDTGNSTWFGFEPDDELPRYHHHVRNIHIKDCTRQDYSVPLGKGETRFEQVFELLNKFKYKGDFVLQAARQEDDIAAGRDYLAFTREHVSRWLS